ncbi:MAG: indole-3-glycerol phosphate synthase TrpC [Candidatus Omnitrophota bacterium]
MSFIEEILEHKKILLERTKEELPQDKIEKMAVPFKSRDFKGAISRGGRTNLIAEIKRASPSQGIIRKGFNPVEIAGIYEKTGAAAISVLTEEKYFLGSISYVELVRDSVNLPVLRKDFIISEYQIYESAMVKADAVLLIAAILNKGVLKGLHNEAKSLGMDILVEVHNERDLDKAFAAGAEIIGINNRDLDTFEVDINTTLELMPKISPDKIVVSESGVSSREDMEILRNAGVKSVLIGGVFMKSNDIAKEIKKVMGW